MSGLSSISKLQDSIAKLTTAIDQYSLAVEKKIAELKSAKSSAEITVAQSEEEQQIIKEKIKRTNVEKAELENVLNEKQTELDNAIAENTNIGKELEDATRSLNFTDSVLNSIADDFKKTQERISVLNTTIADKEKEASELMEQLQRERDLAMQANINKDEEISNKNQEIADKYSQIQAIQIANVTLSEQQKEQITNLERDKATLEQQKTVLEAQNADLLKSNTEKIQKKDGLISKLETDYNSKEAELKESITNLKLENDAAAKIIDQLQSELEESKKLTAEEKENNKKLLAEINEKQNELDKQLADIENVNEVITKIHTDINKLQTNQEALTSQHRNCQSKIDELNNQIEEANIKITKLQAIIKDRTNKLNSPGYPDVNNNEGSTEHRLGVPYQGDNGNWFIKLKDGEIETVIPYDNKTNHPITANDEYGNKITWEKTAEGIYKKVTVPVSNGKVGGEPISQNYTVKGGRKRKASKTIKNTIKKHVSNKRNTKRKNKHHKKQTYKR
jgi:chromosome segregation ATPase